MAMVSAVRALSPELLVTRRIDKVKQGHCITLHSSQGSAHTGVVLSTAVDAAIVASPVNSSAIESTELPPSSSPPALAAVTRPDRPEFPDAPVASVAEALRCVRCQSDEEIGSSHFALFASPPAAEDRGKLSSPLPLGISALDALAPVAYGQSMLIVHDQQSRYRGRSALWTATNEACTSGVACFAVVSGDAQCNRESDLPQLSSQVRRLVLEHTASTEAELLVLCRALAEAEAKRSEGEHALVAIDDLSCLYHLWETMKPENALEEGAAGVYQQQERSNVDAGNEEEEEERESSEIVETDDGVLMQAETAERRAFVASVLQRAGQLSEERCGGSVTILAGVPYTASSRTAWRAQQLSEQAMPLAESHPNLTEEQRRKLQEEAAAKNSNDHDDQNDGDEAAGGKLTWQDALELMSLSDGQVVLTDTGSHIAADTGATFSRIGSEAAAAGVRAFSGNTTRLKMVQAQDSIATTRSDWLASARELFSQECGERRPIEWTVMAALALKHGRAPSRDEISRAVDQAFKEAPEAMKRASATKRDSQLGESDEESLLNVFR
jgi:hypothetical protein